MVDNIITTLDKCDKISFTIRNYFKKLKQAKYNSSIFCCVCNIYKYLYIRYLTSKIHKNYNKLIKKYNCILINYDLNTIILSKRDYNRINLLKNKYIPNIVKQMEVNNMFPEKYMYLYEEL